MMNRMKMNDEENERHEEAENENISVSSSAVVLCLSTFYQNYRSMKLSAIQQDLLLLREVGNLSLLFLNK